MKRFPLPRSSHFRVFGLVFAASLYSALAQAGGYLAAEPMMGTKVQIDGMLREWPGGFVRLKSGATGAGKSQALVAYDEKFLYLGAKIVDTNIVRTKAGGDGEDHLTLEIYFPQPGGGGKTHQLSVYPGVPGKTAALVKLDGKSLSSGEAIEAPTDDGYTLEARVPWSVLPEASAIRVGMRGKLTYTDASAVGRIQSVSSTAGGSGASMQPLSIGPETGLIQELLEPKNLGFVPDKEAYADVTGKGGMERIALYGHFLSIVGPGYKDGKEFYFSELDVEKANQVTRLSTLDFNGDRKSEIVLQKRLGTPTKYREVIQVLQVGSDGAPVQVFFHEVAIVTPEGNVHNKVTIVGDGKSARIQIGQGTAEGFKPGSYREPTLGEGIPSALLPWQEIGERSFGWKGASLAMVDESAWKPKAGRKKPGGGRSPSALAQKAPPPPRPPNPEEMLDRVYALYKQDRGVSNGKKPSFDFVTDVVEDEQMERVLIHERDLVVFGKGFKKGLSYSYLTIGVKDPKDILSVTTRDILGDGKAEILVHAVLDAQASESLGGDVVSRQVLFVYKVIGENLKRIFAAETARSLKGKRILGAVSFVQTDGATELELRPLRSLGWTQTNYPFPEDKHPAGGMEPLLLPWSTVGARRYSFQDGEYRLK